MNIGINGLGRIGRVILRHLWLSEKFNCVQINEINSDIESIAYLIKYDSIYGKFNADVIPLGENCIEIKSDEKRWEILITHDEDIQKADWASRNVDYVIECSGLEENAVSSKMLMNQGVKNVLITNTFYDADITVVLGVNDNILDGNKHKVISTSICDVNAIAPVLHKINRHYKIEHCFLTTMHPWLSYQNILDGPVRSQSNLNKFYSSYHALGRSSVDNLIPKSTTAGDILEYMMPELSGKITSFSMRVPISIVASADISLIMKDKVSIDNIDELLKCSDNDVFRTTKDQLISCDYVGEFASSVIDYKWLTVRDDKFIKLVLWYDNEWGYSKRVIDILEVISN